MAPANDSVSHMAVEYYLWLSDNGGTDPDTLLSRTSSPRDRRELLDRMDDINCVWAVTAPLRTAARADGRVRGLPQSKDEYKSN